MTFLLNPHRFAGAAGPAGAYSGYSTIGSILAAWGPRLLKTGYSGALLRIRDTNDESEQDVGFDAEGDLASFSVVGQARVVRLYDQSGNGNHLGNTTAAAQPQLLPTGSISGKAILSFADGDNYLRDETAAATNLAYMVANPVVIHAMDRDSTANAWRTFFGVPHADGAHATPFWRYGLGQYGSGGTRVNVTVEGSGGNFVNAVGAGGGMPAVWVFNATFADLFVYNGTVLWSLDYDNAISYPSATRMVMGANGALSEFSIHKHGELVVASGGATISTTERDAILADLNSYYGE